MNKPAVLTFFNNKGGVGKTSLVYHLAWTYAELGQRVLVADLDPQANLTAAFLDEDAINALWQDENSNKTIYQCIKPLLEVGDVKAPELTKITENLHLIPGDVALSGFEDAISEAWPNTLNDKNLYRPVRVVTAFWQALLPAIEHTQADIVLVDIGPNLGAINRSVLIATDYVIIPMGADLFSLQGLRNLGPAMQSWKKAWKKRRENWLESPDCQQHPTFNLPEGKMSPLGYLCQQHGVRLDRPVKAYDRWIIQIPQVYRQYVLGESQAASPANEQTPDTDPFCIGTIKHYRSLIPMAQEHRKPIFKLTSADGAIGSHAAAVQSAKQDFKNLAKSIDTRIQEAE